MTSTLLGGSSNLPSLTTQSPSLSTCKGTSPHHPSSTHYPGINMKVQWIQEPGCYVTILPSGSSWTVWTLNRWLLTPRSPVTLTKMIYLDARVSGSLDQVRRTSWLCHQLLSVPVERFRRIVRDVTLIAVIHSGETSSIKSYDGLWYSRWQVVSDHLSLVCQGYS